MSVKTRFVVIGLILIFRQNFIGESNLSGESIKNYFIALLKTHTDRDFYNMQKLIISGDMVVVEEVTQDVGSMVAVALIVGDSKIKTTFIITTIIITRTATMTINMDPPNKNILTYIIITSLIMTQNRRRLYRQSTFTTQLIQQVVEGRLWETCPSLSFGAFHLIQD